MRIVYTGLCFATVLVLISCQSLHYYTQTGNTKKLNTYLAEGGDINARNSGGETALMQAVRNGNLEMIDFLLNAGADINASYAPSGLTPLRIAIEQNNAPLVSVLIDRGADVNQTNEVNWSPIMSAVRNADIPIIQILIDAGADYKLETTLGRDILTIAEHEGRIYIAAYLRSTFDFFD